MKSMINLDVFVRISDPWDLGEILDWRQLAATIISTSHDMVMIRIHMPFDYKGQKCEYFIASPRHEGDSLHALLRGQSVFCGLTQITSKKANENPFDLSKWRGGIAIIGNLDPA